MISVNNYVFYNNSLNYKKSKVKKKQDMNVAIILLLAFSSLFGCFGLYKVFFSKSAKAEIAQLNQKVKTASEEVTKVENLIRKELNITESEAITEETIKKAIETLGKTGTKDPKALEKIAKQLGIKTLTEDAIVTKITELKETETKAKKELEDTLNMVKTSIGLAPEDNISETILKDKLKKIETDGKKELQDTIKALGTKLKISGTIDIKSINNAVDHLMYQDTNLKSKIFKNLGLTGSNKTLENAEQKINDLTLELKNAKKNNTSLQNKISKITVDETVLKELCTLTDVTYSANNQKAIVGNINAALQNVLKEMKEEYKSIDAITVDKIKKFKQIIKKQAETAINSKVGEGGGTTTYLSPILNLFSDTIKKDEEVKFIEDFIKDAYRSANGITSGDFTNKSIKSTDLIKEIEKNKQSDKSLAAIAGAVSVSKDKVENEIIKNIPKELGITDLSVGKRGYSMGYETLAKVGGLCKEFGNSIKVEGDNEKTLQNLDAEITKIKNALSVTDLNKDTLEKLVADNTILTNLCTLTGVKYEKGNQKAAVEELNTKLQAVLTKMKEGGTGITAITEDQIDAFKQKIIKAQAETDFSPILNLFSDAIKKDEEVKFIEDFIKDAYRSANGITGGNVTNKSIKSTDLIKEIEKNKQSDKSLAAIAGAVGVNKDQVEDEIITNIPKELGITDLSVSKRGYSMGCETSAKVGDLCKEFGNSIKVEGDNEKTFKQLTNALTDIKAKLSVTDLNKDTLEKLVADKDVLTNLCTLTGVKYSENDQKAAVDNINDALQALLTTLSVKSLKADDLKFVMGPDVSAKVKEVCEEFGDSIKVEGDNEKTLQNLNVKITEIKNALSVTDLNKDTLEKLVADNTVLEPLCTLTGVTFTKGDQKAAVEELNNKLQAVLTKVKEEDQNIDKITVDKIKLLVGLKTIKELAKHFEIQDSELQDTSVTDILEKVKKKKTTEQSKTSN